MAPSAEFVQRFVGQRHQGPQRLCQAANIAGPALEAVVAIMHKRGDRIARVSGHDRQPRATRLVDDDGPLIVMTRKPCM